MDGARFANAVAAMQVHPKELTWRAGVDVLTFGGTKSGMPMGEAVVFFDKNLATEFDYRCKQAGQLASKMRYLSAPWYGLLKDEAMLGHAGHANACAQKLSAMLLAVPGVRLVHPTEANAVFVELPEQTIAALRSRGWVFYTFIGSGHCRFMCSWATTDEDISSLVNDLQEITG
jgi:threonine aldolase